MLASLDIPVDIQAQPFYMSSHPSSSGLLDLFQSIGHAGSVLPEQAPHSSLLHPDDMLW
jgi:hypothetical protein